MSDTFDHESDAWEQHINMDGEDSYSSNFEYNLLYHHNFLNAKKVNETSKAYLFDDTRGKFWVPKKLIRTKNNNYYIWEGYDFDYIEEHDLEEIDGNDIDFSTPEKKIQKEVETFLKKSKPKAIIVQVQPLWSDKTEYDKDVAEGFTGTYAKWCSKDLPF